MQELRGKVIAIVAITGMFAFLAFTEDTKLGLDLSGGIQLLLQVDTDEAVQAEIRDNLDSLGRVFTDEAVSVDSAAADELVGATIVASSAGDADRVVELVAEYFPNTYSVSRNQQTITLRLVAAATTSVRDGAVRQALQTIRNRVDEYGVTEPVIQRKGLSGDELLVQLPGVENPERVKALLRNTALLELKMVEMGPALTRQELITASGGALAATAEILAARPEDQVPAGFYVVQRDPVVTGRDLRTARMGQDELSLPAVNFTLNADGGRTFAEFTSANIGRQLAIVLDNEIYSAPVIEGRIAGNGQIKGRFSVTEAEDLALVLRSGALPASIRYLEERSVGPSLGRDSINRGVLSAGIGFAIVVAFMLVYYRGAGINAVVALGLNLVVVLGVMNALGAALTLPGIAGMILLIGMAVDANVLIFERIREELNIGKTVRSSIDSGFAKAFSAIVDANITTLVAAVFLFQFGTGPVQGFAVTISIGILASMFTSIFVSRVLFDIWTRQRPRALSI